MAKVRIMPERVLPDFLEGARPPSHQKLGVSCSELDNTSGIDFSTGDHAAVLKRFIETTKNNKRRVLAPCVFTVWI